MPGRPLRLDGEEVVIWAEVAGAARDRLRVLVAPLGADILARDQLFRLPQDVRIKPIEVRAPALAVGCAPLNYEFLERWGGLLGLRG